MGMGSHSLNRLTVRRMKVDKLLTILSIIVGTASLALVAYYSIWFGISTTGAALMGFLVVGQFTLTCGIRSMMKGDRR